MTTQQVSRLSQCMAILTLVIIVLMLLLNIASWFYPSLFSSVEGGYGFGYGLSTHVSGLMTDLTALSWWQFLGGIVLSSIPLLVLAFGLYQLYKLFQNYAQGTYFSASSAVYLGRVGYSVALWVLLDFICEPLLGLCLTFNAPAGERLITLSLTSSTIVALFLAGCIVIIAHILKQASDIDNENKQFI